MATRKGKLLGSIVGCVVIFVLLSTAYYLYFYSQDYQSQSSQAVSSVLTAQSSKVFEPVLPNVPVVLPRDFAFHNEFQHEWWHYFANVTDQHGEEYGVQWSYFRVAHSDNDFTGWLSPQIYASHIVISNGRQVWREQRISRGGIGQAGMSNAPFRIWIDNWYWRSLGKTPFPGQLTASSDSFDLSLTTTVKGPYVLPGERGYREKHDLLPVASYNLTAPFLRVKGELKLGDSKLIQVEGSAWMSKEWGSGLMTEQQQGWDWFVLHLDDETTLSLSRYRHENQLPYIFGTLATNDGKVIDIAPDEISLIPLQSTYISGTKKVPLHWTINIPRYDISLTTKVLNSSLWLPFVIPYWEGPISATGSHNAKGFIQLTGY